jgi:hypothetical protein
VWSGGVEHRPRELMAVVAPFLPMRQWHFDHGPHHYGHFANCTALRPTASGYPSMTSDGRVGRSSLALRSMRRSRRARNCSLVSVGQLARADASHIAFLSETWTPDLASIPNSHVSPYDAAYPGTLPVGNCSSRFCRVRGRTQPFHSVSIPHA